jgi:hypothetical protein
MDLIELRSQISFMTLLKLLSLLCLFVATIRFSTIARLTLGNVLRESPFQLTQCPVRYEARRQGHDVRLSVE